MRRHPIFTLNRPFKRRVHNNYLSFPTIDGGDGFERPKPPIFTTPRCPRSPNTINTRPCSILLRVGGPRARSARPYRRSSAGRAPSLPSPRTKHVFAKPSSQKPRGYVYPQLSCETPPVLRLHVPIRGHFCVLRSRLLVITDFKRAVRAYQACWRWPGPLLRPIGGCTAVGARLHAVLRPRERFSHSRRSRSCISRTNA